MDIQVYCLLIQCLSWFTAVVVCTWALCRGILSRIIMVFVVSSGVTHDTRATSRSRAHQQSSESSSIAFIQQNWQYSVCSPYSSHLYWLHCTRLPCSIGSCELARNTHAKATNRSRAHQQSSEPLSLDSPACPTTTNLLSIDR